jgi:lipoprotein-anchoring transpeptidase ErfK/SrfK
MIDDVFAPRQSVAIVLRAPGRRLRWIVTGAIVALGALLFVAARGTGYTYGPAPQQPAMAAPTLPADPGAARKLQAKLLTQNKQAAAQLHRLSPAGTYVVVDQTQNRLYIMNDDKIVRTAVCSAGSGMVLKASGSSKKWVFDTPRGLFKVRTKISNPIWRKPDWAFVEEGKTVPKNPADRFESGTLGKYALYLEDGYMIHGTLYTRLLGRSVTHGCIRLGADDLQAVWDAVPVGSSVYIF